MRTLTAIRRIAFFISCRSYSQRFRSASFLLLVRLALRAASVGTRLRASNSRTFKSSCVCYSMLSSSPSSRTIYMVSLKISTWVLARDTSSAKSAAISQRLKISSVTCSCPSRMSLRAHLRTSQLRKLYSSTCARRLLKATMLISALAVVRKSRHRRVTRLTAYQRF